MVSENLKAMEKAENFYEKEMNEVLGWMFFS